MRLLPAALSLSVDALTASRGLAGAAKRTLTFALCAALLIFAGCGSRPLADRETESDLSEARKRAALRMELAVGYFEQGQTNIALDEVKLALAADPQYAQAYNLRGLIYARLGDVSLAEDSYRRALQIAPRDADVMHNFGWLQCTQTRYAAADDWFNKALATEGYARSERTWLVKAQCQQRAGQSAQALQSYRRAYEQDAGNPVAGYNLGLLNYQARNYEQAQFYLRRLNNSELANAQTLWLGLKTERQLGQTMAAQQLGQQLNRRFGNSPEAQLLARGAFNE